METPKRAIKFSSNEFYSGLFKRWFTTDGKMTQTCARALCRAGARSRRA